MSDDFGVGLAAGEVSRGNADFVPSDDFPRSTGEHEDRDDVDDRDEDLKTEGNGAAGGEETTPDTGEFPRKRRRRRRRRGGRGGERGVQRGGPPSAAAPPAGEEVSEADWDESEPAPSAPIPTAAQQEDDESDTDGGDRPEPTGGDRPPRPRRRGRDSRERRRYGPPPDWNEDDFGAVEADESTAEPPRQAPVEEEIEPTELVSYDDVPTWEEAISYLLRPNQVQAESGGPPRSPPPSEGQRPSRHYGGRRPPPRRS